MRAEITTTGLGEAAARLSKAGAGVQEKWRASLHRTGTEAKNYIIERYRTGGTTSDRTAVRSGKLRRAYRFAVTRKSGVMELSVGLLRAKTDSDVLQYGRMQEGFNASGQRVSQFIIRPKKPGGVLIFPKKYARNPPPRKVRSKVTGKKVWNREDYVFAKQVTLKPRPAFPGTQKKFEPILRKRLEEGFAAAVGGS